MCGGDAALCQITLTACYCCCDDVGVQTSSSVMSSVMDQERVKPLDDVTDYNQCLGFPSAS